MSNIEYRPVVKFCTRKGFNATEISKKLDSIYKDDAASYRTVAGCVVEFNKSKRAFEDSSRTGRPSTSTTDEHIEAVEPIVMHDRPISAHRQACELPIPTTTTVYEIMSNHLGMKKVSKRWVPKLLTSIQRNNRVDCCRELLRGNEVNPDNYYDRIVTGDEIWVYYYGSLNQQEIKVWKKPDEETPTRLSRKKSAEKVIFWDKYGILLTECLPRRTTINGPYYASIIERLRCAILETSW